MVYNPAGIFSTDDPIADQMQIDCERGPGDEDYEELNYEDSIYAEMKDVYSACACGWWSKEMSWDKGDIEEVKKRLAKQHGEDQPYCDANLEFTI